MMDPTTFRNSIVPLYKPMFAAAAAILGDRDEAADAVQDAMERLWQARESLDAIQSLPAYCMTVLRRVAIDRIRRRRQTEPIDNIPETAAPPDNTARETSAIIDRIIATLPSNQQTVIRLSAFEQKSNDEIAVLTGLSNDNVRQLLSRARRRIKELYKKYTEI
ncbi:MAG: sigma-70 family RNA polymerase sigma factor [Bacteroidales bacterium]|nr:sigma-70 family RNA polymerase sigma factor [Bacteroidales bacterium]